MTLQEINSKYSFKELQSMPGDGEFRRKLFTPFLEDLYENKIIYFERSLSIVTLKDIINTPELFEATAIPYINIEKPSGHSYALDNEPWTFGAAWPYMRLLDDHFGTYGGWLIWTDKELVKVVEELARKKDFEFAYELTAYKGYSKK
jgi:hypothetical protein